MNWRKVSIVSVGVNVLLAALMVKSQFAAGHIESANPDQPFPTSSSTAPQVITRQLEITNRIPAPELEWPHWEQLISVDWREFRTNLLAVGCPGETVRDILRASIDRELFDQRRDMISAVNPIFWDEVARYGVESKTGQLAFVVEKIEDLDQKYRQIMESALTGLPNGDAVEQRLQEQKSRADQFGHLDPALQQKAEELETEFVRRHEQISLAQRDKNNQITPDGQAALRQLEEDHRRELSDLMGPEGTLEWRLRTSGQANWAASIRGLEASPEELRQIAVWKLAFDDAHPRTATQGAPNYEQQKQESAEAETRLNSQLKDLLGDERYALVERSNDGKFVQLHDLGERFELSEQTIDQALQMQQDANHAAEQIRANAELTAAQRRDALRAVRQETGQAYQSLLGDEAYHTYQRHGGEWIDSLSALNANR